MKKLICTICSIGVLLASCEPQSESKTDPQSTNEAEIISPANDKDDDTERKIETDVAMHEKVSQLFLAHCANNIPQLEKVEASARVFSWQELTKDQATMVAPMEQDAWFKGWFVQDENIGPYMLGISRSELNGKKMAACSIATDSADVDLVVSRMEELLELKTQTVNETNGGQRSRIWRTDYPSPGTLLIVVDAKAMKVPSFSFTITTPDI